MKTKTIPLFALTILSLVMIAGLANAAIILNPDTYTTSIQQGNSGSFNFNITVDYPATESNATFTTSLISNLTSGANTIDASNILVGALPSTLEAGATSSNIAVTINVPSSAVLGTYTGVITVDAGRTDPANANPNPKTIALTITVTAPTPPITTNTPTKIQECSTTGNSGNYLRIEIDELDVVKNSLSGYGFGDNEEWLPLDNIQVDIKVDNEHSTDRIRNIEVRWGLYDKNKDRWYIDEKESDFTLKDGDDKTLTVNFKLDDNIDDLAEGDYVFYVWANGNIDDDNKTEVCASDSQDVDMIIESDFVILDNIQVADTVECDSEVQLTADVWNIGDEDQEGVYVLISSPQLGINNKEISIGDIDAFEKARLDVLLDIPKDVDGGKFYPIKIYVYNQDNEVYQNDYDDDESEFQVSVKVEGNCGAVVPATVSASLQSGGTAGEQLVIKAIVTADETGTYVLKATGYTDWATTDTTQLPLVLTANTPKEAVFTFNVNDDVSGSKTFNLELVSGTDTILTQPVSVTIEPASSGFGFGNLNLGGNAYLWGIAILNIILVVVIIIVAIKVAAK